MITTILASLLMIVPKINVDVKDAAIVQQTLDALEPQRIACCNWPEIRPYVPEVTFRIFHTGKYMVIRYDVKEKCTAAAAGVDDGKVWEDSCVEFFMSTDNCGHYYNFEANCIGKMHIGYRKVGERAVHANPEQFALVQRFPTIGTEPFAEKVGDNHWQLTIIVPVKALFGDNLRSWSGLKARMNFYKCGDKLSEPHYISWAPIKTQKPNFHKPEFFQEVLFEK